MTQAIKNPVSTTIQKNGINIITDPKVMNMMAHAEIYESPKGVANIEIPFIDGFFGDGSWGSVVLDGIQPSVANKFTLGTVYSPVGITDIRMGSDNPADDYVLTVLQIAYPPAGTTLGTINYTKWMQVLGVSGFSNYVVVLNDSSNGYITGDSILITSSGDVVDIICLTDRAFMFYRPQGISVGSGTTLKLCTYTLESDGYFQNLEITNQAILFTNGYRLFARKITNNGRIHNNASIGATGYFPSHVAGANGGDGGVQFLNSRTDGLVGGTGIAKTNSIFNPLDYIGSTGGKGADGTAGSNDGSHVPSHGVVGGNSGTTTLLNLLKRDSRPLIEGGYFVSGTKLFYQLHGGAGGGGGGGCGGGAPGPGTKPGDGGVGGSGGSGAGYVLVCAKYILGNGKIQSNGGSGFDGGFGGAGKTGLQGDPPVQYVIYGEGGGGGGGAGGSGGIVIIICVSKDSTITLETNYGYGGFGGNTQSPMTSAPIRASGINGSNGYNGTTITLIMT